MPSSVSSSPRPSSASSDLARLGVTTTPSSAIFAAGSSRSASRQLPPIPRSVSHAATAPGTVTESAPRTGMPPCCAASRSAETPAGAAPEPFTTRTTPSGVAASAMMSPPTAHMCG